MSDQRTKDAEKLADAVGAAIVRVLGEGRGAELRGPLTDALRKALDKARPGLDACDLPGSLAIHDGLLALDLGRRFVTILGNGLAGMALAGEVLKAIDAADRVD